MSGGNGDAIFEVTEVARLSTISDVMEVARLSTISDVMEVARLSAGTIVGLMMRRDEATDALSALQIDSRHKQNI